MSNMMAEYFTLDPRYKHYEYGGVKLAFKTVYNEAYLERFDIFNLSFLALVAGVTFISFAQLDSSAGQKLNIFTIGIGVVFIAITFGIIMKISRYVETLNKVKRLQYAGTLIDGTLISCVRNTKHPYWRGDTMRKYLSVRYEFTAPDQQHLLGTQIRILDEMWGKVPASPGTPVRYRWTHELAINQPTTGTFLFQPKGTPIRVLYADPETYVML
ncbi:MAG: hypothetical protein KF716_07505 [Anaerolineae bacterium]|nr:hypothetical protein [Anaerolineae bacterium]